MRYRHLQNWRGFLNPHVMPDVSRSCQTLREFRNSRISESLNSQKIQQGREESGETWQDLARFAMIRQELTRPEKTWVDFDKIWQDSTRFGEIRQDAI